MRQGILTIEYAALFMILVPPAGIWGMDEAIANRFNRRTEGVERA